MNVLQTTQTYTPKLSPIPGDTVNDVLKYVSYSREDLMARVRRFAEQATA